MKYPNRLSLCPPPCPESLVIMPKKITCNHQQWDTFVTQAGLVNWTHLETGESCKTIHLQNKFQYPNEDSNIPMPRSTPKTITYVYTSGNNWHKDYPKHLALI